MMSLLQNADILSVGIAIAANLILGAIIFFKDPRSATNILFLLQTLILSVWSAINYFSYQLTDPNLALLFVRLVMFFAVPNSMIFLFLVYTFPSRQLQFEKKTTLFLIGLTIIGMITALSPLLFPGVKISPGEAPQPIPGPGLIIFIPVAILSVLLGIYFLISRYTKTKDAKEKLQLRYLLIGVALMFTLILVLDFVLASFFQNTRFIPLSAVFTLPFVFFTAYAIVKHHLLEVKIIATEALVFLLIIVSFFEIILSSTWVEKIFRGGVFIALLSVGILLIRSVVREVEQREQLQILSDQLKAANVQLEELSHFKTQLLSLASHQVKAPLAAIKGFASILIDGLYGPVNDKVKDTLIKMRHSSDTLIALINELLDLRKVEEGKMEYKFEAVTLKDIVKDVFESLQSLATEKKLEFTLNVSTDAKVNADMLKLKQVIQNLIDNSIKYTPSGFVHVALENDTSGNVTFSVTDSGLGISLELVPHLFEEFIRDQRIKQQVLGTGLGLFIARKIVEAHGGQIWAESEGPNKGASFKAKLPILK